MAGSAAPQPEGRNLSELTARAEDLFQRVQQLKEHL